MKQKITIIGGTDGFGKWVASFLMRKFGDKIILTVTGRDKGKGESFAENIGVIFSTDNVASVKNADITIFAVPIAYMEESIKEVAPHLQEGSVVADVCSIKDFPTKALKQYCPESVLIIPVHPMFGPFIHSIAGQIFVLTPEEGAKNDARYMFLVDFLKQSGSKVLETVPDEHDKMMAVVQGLTHMDNFIFGETIKRLGIDIKKSLDFLSPVYKLRISSVARYMNQNPKLYSDIQMYNTKVPEVHKMSVQVSQEFGKFVIDKDEGNFVSAISKTQEYFGENAKKGQIYTDKIIFLLSKQIELVKNSIGKSLKFENIYLGSSKQGIVKKFEDDIIYLENGEELVLDEWRAF